ncbi:TIGR02466 family protein [Microbulbifer sp. SSSA002]|uniref:TIGR02466 family protein n=1 Tax=Microbulbifer sp. SSSA002 TaxID=3243376 RepID=UPI00403A5593
MAIDVWFPLAIYYTDLTNHSEYKNAFLDRIHTLREQSGKQRTTESASWTGDVHRIDQIHNDPAFAWVTEQVELHSLIYLKTLGHDLSKIDIYIQRSWPIIATKGQYVARHAHHTANLSAVYYISIPTEGYAGQTRFFNETRQNELSSGIGSNMTEGYSEFNPLNFQQANYDPVEGRLLLFPSKQMHDVAANETDEERVTLSFDLVLTAKNSENCATPEFLMPSPEHWKRVTQILPETDTETALAGLNT